MVQSHFSDSFVKDKLRIVVISNVAKLKEQLSSWTNTVWVFLMLPCVVAAQSPEALIRKANLDETSLGEKHALLYQAWLLDSSDIDLRYDLALTSRHLGLHHDALHHLTKIYEKDEGKLYPDNLNIQAQLYARLGKTEIAIELYEKYLRRHKTSACSECLKSARTELDNLKWSRKNRDSALPFLLSVYNKIDSLGLPQIWSKGLNGHKQMTFIGCSKDQMFLNYCNEDCDVLTGSTLYSDSMDMSLLESIQSSQKFCAYNGEIFSVVVNENSFQFTDESGKILTRYPAFHFNSEAGKHSTPFFTGGNKLYFSSDREGGLGGMDIWCSVLENGLWSEAFNLGKPYNTPGDEIFPVVQDSILYFSSNGHKGFGGLDVYAINTIDRKLVHLAAPVCSAADDIAPYFLFSEGRGRMMWSSNRAVSSASDACCYNIWFVDFHMQKIPETTDLSITENFVAGIDAQPLQLYFHNDEPDPRSRVCRTSSDYQSCIQSYLSLRQNYLNDTYNVTDTSLLQQFFDEQLDYSSRRIDTLSNCIQRELEMGRTAAIIVKGFASKRAANDYNQCLSGRRISCFENTLKKWNGGVLTSPIHAGKLKVIAQPMGEDILSNHKEDDIYSYSSCLARRIEILQMLSG
ncbi:MAG: tetratricopeptide repeat protein, partial [Flavobacteriales bacterium]